MDSRAAFLSPSAGRVANAARWPTAWVLSTTVAMVALAWWQQEPGWWRLVPVVVGTIASAGFLRRVPRPRPFAGLAVAALIAACLTGASESATLETARRDWASWSAEEREDRARRVAERVENIAVMLGRSADAVVQDTGQLSAILARREVVLSPPLAANIESAMLVFRGGMLVARAGQMHTPVSPGGSKVIEVVAGPFHTALVARRRSADRLVEVVSVALVASAPPADRFTRNMLQAMPGGIDIAHTRVEPLDVPSTAQDETTVTVGAGNNGFARVVALAYSEGERTLALRERARLRSIAALCVALCCFVVVAWRRPAGDLQRVGAGAVALVAVALAPLPALSNVSSLFDPRSYFYAMGGPLTSTVAGFLLTTTVLFTVLLFVNRGPSRRRSRVVAVFVVLAGAASGPFLLRDLARGISLPPTGAGFVLWASWQLAIALAGAALLLAIASVGRAAIASHRGVPARWPVALSLASAGLAPVLLTGAGIWSLWYLIPWSAAIGLTALMRRGLPHVLTVAVVAGAGASTLTWEATVRARTALAEHDTRNIGSSDRDAQRLLERFAIGLRDDTERVRTSEALLQRFAASELARAGYAARLARWVPQAMDAPVSAIDLTPVADSLNAQAYVASIAHDSGTVEFREVRDGIRRILLAAVPEADGSVTTVALPPRTSLLPADPFSTFLGLTSDSWREPPYRLSLSAAILGDVPGNRLTWRRLGNALHGDGVAGDGSTLNRIHAEVDLGGLDVLLPRGALLVMLDVCFVLLLWGSSAVVDGSLGRWIAIRRARWSRSYRLQLSAAMLGFFIAPASIFALWAWYRLQGDDRATRELLVRETLRVAAAEQERRPLGAAPSSTGAPLFLYNDGVLREASNPLLEALAPLGRLLPVEFSDEELENDDTFVSRRMSVGRVRALVGFRLLSRPGAVNRPGATIGVLSTPARGNEFALDDRREDLGILVLFATMLGALAAIWSSGIAARALARPVGALREAALDIAAGRPAPTLGTAPATEFAPVYQAFTRMADDLQTSRSALEAAQRRTEAVLQNVASGVVALLRDGDIILANPRAGALLGAEVRRAPAMLSQLPARLSALVAQCTAFLARDDDEEAFGLLLNGRQLQARLTRLPTGAVLTVDDITELASAQRVLAWGEMARQVAHEIKNPLTPIRLGVQHLRRAYRDRRGDFGEILDRNVSRVLEEIDHLDEIARAFSRYGTAPSERAPGVPVNVAAVVHDVVALEKLGDHAEPRQRVRWEVVAPDDASMFALAQRDELREVLINVLENARLAGATAVAVALRPSETAVVIDVADNGSGIAPDVLPHVFEPHFSTRTSGSGLGLAISRRLIEGWGGTIGVTSAPGQGTVVHITLVRTAGVSEDAAEAGRR